MRLLRLETGDKQEAAQAFYHRHSFLHVAGVRPVRGQRDLGVHATTTLTRRHQLLLAVAIDRSWPGTTAGRELNSPAPDIGADSRRKTPSVEMNTESQRDGGRK